MASTSRHQQLWHQRWKFVHGIDVSSHKWTLAQLLWLCFASQPYLSCWQCAVAGATSRGQREKCITRTRSAKPTADWAESAALLPSLDSQRVKRPLFPPSEKFCLPNAGHPTFGRELSIWSEKVVPRRRQEEKNKSHERRAKDRCGDPIEIMTRSFLQI